MSKAVGFCGCAFLLLTIGLSPARAQNYNLGLDWSDAANPNSVWAYRQGVTNLSSGTWAFDFTSQPAWLGANPAVWFRAQSTAGFDVQVGDVVTHSSSGASPLVNVTWTSPNGGTIDIIGGVWMIRDIGRAGTWLLRHNGSLLSQGSLSSGDPFNRANPFNLDAGSGGALDNLTVSAGDVIELSFQATGTGDYNGVNLAITLTAVPEPSALLLGGLAATALGCMAVRRMKKHWHAHSD